mmetsp:Transcript_35357/g.112769  ORF Transcript_35357/g.112769 Transcript_35357/m.112769 type:complete len:215 (-) Transcript_35357:1-645(-)
MQRRDSQVRAPRSRNAPEHARLRRGPRLEQHPVGVRPRGVHFRPRWKAQFVCRRRIGREHPDEGVSRHARPGLRFDEYQRLEYIGTPAHCAREHLALRADDSRDGDELRPVLGGALGGRVAEDQRHSDLQNPHWRPWHVGDQLDRKTGPRHGCVGLGRRRQLPHEAVCRGRGCIHRPAPLNGILEEGVHLVRHRRCASGQADPQVERAHHLFKH